MKQALILHGTDATPQSNWFTWLKDELEEEGYKVWLPQLPNSTAPNARIYTSFLLANSDFVFDDETIIVGHSSGAVEALHLLENLPENAKVKAAFLVSAFKDDLGWDALGGLFDEPFDFASIKTKADKFTFLHSDNDPYCPIEHAQYLSEQVGSELIIKSGQGHFNTELGEQYKVFPELLEIIRENAAGR
ncbi:hypothetical protein EOM60_05665 [Candidatus Saccharibacteria bacterium]|nr:hypothetical protein [Candidatus Saccharibacteria bacterium]